MTQNVISGQQQWWFRVFPEQLAHFHWIYCTDHTAWETKIKCKKIVLGAVAIRPRRSECSGGGGGTWVPKAPPPPLDPRLTNITTSQTTTKLFHGYHRKKWHRTHLLCACSAYASAVDQLSWCFASVMLYTTSAREHNFLAMYCKRIMQLYQRNNCNYIVLYNICKSTDNSSEQLAEQWNGNHWHLSGTTLQLLPCLFIGESNKEKERKKNKGQVWRLFRWLSAVKSRAKLAFNFWRRWCPEMVYAYAAWSAVVARCYIIHTCIIRDLHVR